MSQSEQKGRVDAIAELSRAMMSYHNANMEAWNTGRRDEYIGRMKSLEGKKLMDRLREEIGEDHLNRALAAFIRDKAFQHAPFTTSKEFLEYVRAETPPEKYALLDDLFAKIVLYDNRVTDARVKKRPDGKYDVEIDVAARKMQADGVGKEAAVPLDDWMEIGVFARAEHPHDQQHDQQRKKQ